MNPMEKPARTIETQSVLRGMAITAIGIVALVAIASLGVAVYQWASTPAAKDVGAGFVIVAIAVLATPTFWYCLVALICASVIAHALRGLANAVRGVQRAVRKRP